jgi:hypothetical protein
VKGDVKLIVSHVVTSTTAANIPIGDAATGAAPEPGSVALLLPLVTSTSLVILGRSRLRRRQLPVASGLLPVAGRPRGRRHALAASRRVVPKRRRSFVDDRATGARALDACAVSRNWIQHGTIPWQR